MVLRKFLNSEKGEKFPPEEFEEKFAKMKEWSAWYSADNSKLLDFYTSNLTYPNTNSGKFWSKIEQQEREEKVHIPLAKDIAKMSASLLFSEEPQMIIPQSQEENPKQDALYTQQRLNEITNKNNTYSNLVEAGETASALGGTYLKVVWDKEVKDVPLLRVAQADNAIPKFKFGYLVKVTFFKTVREEGNFKYRLLEVHSKGKIQNFLYKGNKTYLGEKISLNSIEETKGMEQEIETGIDDILVRYIPNDLPNRIWRGCNIGNSDLQGLESMLDSLDEVYSSWMREIRLSKAEKVVPESWLSYNENSGRLEYRDQMTYTGMNVPPDEMNEPKLIQPSMRESSYKNTCLHLIERIVTSAGFAPQSFGLNIKGRAESGTALRVRERKSLKTKQRKERYFKQPLQEILQLMLKVDKIHFNTKVNPDYMPRVKFADSIADDPTEISESLRDLEQAQAMSIEQKVKYLNPDWSDSEVLAEVNKIKEEKGLTDVGG